MIGSTANPFTGTLDGDGFKIHDFTLDTTGDSEPDTALIAKASGATIKNFVLDNFDIDSDSGNKAVLIGSCLNCNIENIKITNSSVSGNGNLGSLVGASE